MFIQTWSFDHHRTLSIEYSFTVTFISYHVKFEPHDKQSPIEHLRKCFAHNSTTTGPMPMNQAPFKSENMPQQSYLKKLGLVGTLYVHSVARVYLTGLKMGWLREAIKYA